MAGRYRIYCSEAEAAGLPAGVVVEARYPAFVIAEVADEAVAEIRRRYPVEELQAAKAPPAVRRVAQVHGAAAEWPERGPYVLAVRFRRPAAAFAEEKLAEAGAEPLASIGSRTWAVRCPSKTVRRRVENLPEVERAQKYVPTIRVSPELLAAPAGEEELPALVEARAGRGRGAKGGPRGPQGLLAARFLTEGDRRRALRRLRRRGIGTVLESGPRGLSIDLTGTADRGAAVLEIAQLRGLQHLSERRPRRHFNDVARAIVGAGVIEPPPAGLGLDGAGEIVAVADSGLDTGNSTTVHADFRGRVRSIQSFPIIAALSGLLSNPEGDDGASDLFSGHGTHVAGSVLGNGSRAQALGLGRIEGTAPGAELVFQAIDQTTNWSVAGQLAWLQAGETPPSHGLFGIPDDLADLFQPAFDQGARIHSNSWGGGDGGVYDEQCEALDRFVFDHPTFLPIVAAGNEGLPAAAGGGIAPGSVNSPAVAKNCLTVGASENARPNQTDAYGDFWPGDFPAAPFHGDPMADQPDDIAAFSGRGPCQNGRRKPDLVAPGTWVLSVRSSQVPTNHFAWGAFTPAKQDYMFMGGTSMATPLVSGCAAVLRQFLRQNQGMAEPSAALLKAGLIHAAQYRPYRFQAPGSGAFADDEQGWGHLELARVVAPAAPEQVRFLDQGPLAEGEQFELEVEVTDATVPLRATLVYTDFPGEDLINNLNLFAFAPSGGFRVGNDFAGTGTPDDVNNVEGIVVTEPEVGTWRLRVVASAMPQGPRGFGLVVSAG